MLTLPSTLGNDCRHHCQHVWGNQKKSIVAGKFKGLSVVPLSKILGCQLGLVQRRTHKLVVCVCSTLRIGMVVNHYKSGFGFESDTKTFCHILTFQEIAQNRDSLAWKLPRNRGHQQGQGGQQPCEIGVGLLHQQQTTNRLSKMMVAMVGGCWVEVLGRGWWACCPEVSGRKLRCFLKLCNLQWFQLQKAKVWCDQWILIPYSQAF